MKPWFDEQAYAQFVRIDNELFHNEENMFRKFVKLTVRIHCTGTTRKSDGLCKGPYRRQAGPRLREIKNNVSQFSGKGVI